MPPSAVFTTLQRLLISVFDELRSQTFFFFYVAATSQYDGNERESIIGKVVQEEIKENVGLSLVSFDLLKFKYPNGSLK